MEGVSNFLRNSSNCTKYHSNKFNVVILYEKFKVINKELRKLRENYYIDLARDKIAVNFFIYIKQNLKNLEWGQ